MNAQENRLKVAIGQSVPNTPWGGGGAYRYVAPWPCKKDHPFEYIYERNGGELRCHACESERRKMNREENVERERQHNKRRYAEGRRGGPNGRSGRSPK